MKGRRISCLIAFILLLATLPLPSASALDPLTFGLLPLEQSKAFQQYLTRPETEYSKIIFLIDRFGEAPIEIVYDGNYFNAVFSSKVARWFLGRNYRKETAREWILKWCNVAIFSGNLIWVKLPNGTFVLSREVLLDELKSLETRALKAEPPTTTTNTSVSLDATSSQAKPSGEMEAPAMLAKTH